MVIGQNNKQTRRNSEEEEEMATDSFDVSFMTAAEKCKILKRNYVFLLA